jgi:hypothetical protein
VKASPHIITLTGVSTEIISFSHLERETSTSGVPLLTISKAAFHEKISCHLSINTSQIVPVIGDVIVSLPYSLALLEYHICASEIALLRLLSVISLFFIELSRLFFALSI